MRTYARLVPTIAASVHHSGRVRGRPQAPRIVAANAAELACPLGNADVLGRRTWNRASPRGGRAGAPEDALDALVDDQALDAQCHRERDDLIGSPRADAARDTDDVPDQAEVADTAGGGEHAVDDRIAADDLEQLASARWSKRSTAGPRLPWPGACSGRHAGASSA